LISRFCFVALRKISICRRFLLAATDETLVDLTPLFEESRKRD
jgi:hypothetical protein